MPEESLDKAYLKTLEQRLKDGQADYTKWVEPINQLHNEKITQVNRDGYSFQDFQDELATVREQQLQISDPFLESAALLDELCPKYLKASSKQRETVREMFKKHQFWIGDALFDYMRKSSDKLANNAGVNALLCGLAAASIEDCSSDYRDTLLALADLFVIAERASIKPQPYFTAVAELSSKKKPRGASESMQHILKNFHTYAVVAERRGK